jgi:glycerophosphoryl diester phosphodiesterase
MPDIEIVAHRGASHDAPENTLAAIELAWQQGADAVEIDIRLCKSGEIVVIHDANTLRVAGMDKPIGNQTWDELRRLDFGSWKDIRFAGEKIPSLDEVIQTIPDGKRLQIEVKCGPEIVLALQNCLVRSGKLNEQFLFACFSACTLREFKKTFSGIPAFWIQDLSKNLQNDNKSLEELLHQAQTAEFEGVNLGYADMLDVAIVPIVKTAGLQLCVWPVDSVELAKSWIAAGVDSITTNRPADLCGQVR